MRMEQPKSPKHWPEISSALIRYGAWKPNTTEAHRQAALLLDEFQPRTISQPEINQLRQAVLRRYKLNAARSYLGRLRTILRRAYGRDDLVLKVPRGRPAETLPLTVEQTSRLFEALMSNEGAYAALLLEYESALRPAEVIGLNMEHVRPEAREILVPHGKTGMRTVNVSHRTMEALQRWFTVRKAAPGHETAVFLNRYGRRPSVSGFLRKHVKMAAAAAGIDQRIYPNLLRAGIATHMLNMNVNPEVVQRHMGHKDIRTTMVYNRTSSADQKRIVGETWDRLSGTQEKPIPRDVRRELGEALVRGEIGLGELRTLLGTIESVTPSKLETGKGYA